MTRSIDHVTFAGSDLDRLREAFETAGFVPNLVRWLLWIVDSAPWCLPLVGFITGLTTVGHRAEQQFGIGVNARPARGYGFSNGAGTQAFLEGIGGNNQFHQSSTRLSNQTVMIPAMPCIRVPRVCAR